MSPDASTVCVFPHAGGSAQDYVAFASAFTGDIHCVAVQYPGRRSNHDLGSFISIPQLAGQVYDKLAPLLQAGRPVAFFGHSMGALVAFDTARRAEAAGHRISALFVSACAAPGQSGHEYLPATDRGLLEAVGTLTGGGSAMLENEEFANRILPTLRGIRAIVNYECAVDAAVSCPISAFLGDADDVAPLVKVQPWAGRTTAGFSVRSFPGGHFYLHEHVTELAGDIETALLTRCLGDSTPPA